MNAGLGTERIKYLKFIAVEFRTEVKEGFFGVKNVVKKGMGISLEFRLRHWIKFPSRQGEEAANRDGSTRARTSARIEAVERGLVFMFFFTCQSNKVFMAIEDWQLAMIIWSLQYFLVLVCTLLDYGQNTFFFTLLWTTMSSI